MHKTTQESPPDSGEVLLTVTEAAAIVRVSKQSICRYSDQGKLPTLRTPGNHRRFRRSDVEALLQPQS